MLKDVSASLCMKIVHIMYKGTTLAIGMNPCSTIGVSLEKQSSFVIVRSRQ